jgi:hypothetical protein
MAGEPLIEIRPWLLVGRYTDTLDFVYLRENGVNAMLELHDEVDESEIDVLFLPIDEGEPLLPDVIDRGLNFVEQHRQAGDRVLIACSAGVSRSVVFAVGALRRAEGLSLLDAFRAIHTIHPRAMPDIVHWDALCQYFGEDIPFLSIWND